MNRAMRRRREREDAAAAAHDYQEQVRGLAETKAHLLNIINVIVMGAGGRVEIPVSKLEDQRGYPVNVDTIAPDPELAGSEGQVVITLEGWKPPKEKPGEVAERMKERGLWIPGRDD